MPQLADGMESGTIVAWLVPAGSAVAVGDELVEIETDKAAMAYAAEQDGYLEIVAEPGATLPVGDVIARLHPAPLELSAPSSPDASDSDEAGLALAQTDEHLAPAVIDEVPGEPSDPVPASTAAIRATPIARRMAAIHGVDLATLTGSGPRGTITRGDVARSAGLALTASGPSTTAPPSKATRATDPAVGSAIDGARGARVPERLSRVQQTIARRMAESKATIPHFQVQTEAVADALFDLRAQLKSEGTLTPTPSINELIIKAAALALREFPRANGVFEGDQFELYQRINVGFAVATSGALLVPVITDADRKPLGEISQEARRLADRVRDGSITPPELAGGTFTVSNLGMFGMTAIFPVINPGQAAILGVGAARVFPTLDDGQLREKQLLTLTLSCDHRILYGADAAEFLRRIARILEAPLQLLL